MGRLLHEIQEVRYIRKLMRLNVMKKTGKQRTAEDKWRAVLFLMLSMPEIEKKKMLDYLLYGPGVFHNAT